MIACLGKREQWFAGTAFIAPASSLKVPLRCTYRVRYSLSDRKEEEGFTRRQVLGSYIHLHFRSNPSLVSSFLQQADSTRRLVVAQ